MILGLIIFQLCENIILPCDLNFEVCFLFFLQIVVEHRREKTFMVKLRPSAFTSLFILNFGCPVVLLAPSQGNFLRPSKEAALEQENQKGCSQARVHSLHQCAGCGLCRLRQPFEFSFWSDSSPHRSLLCRMEFTGKSTRLIGDTDKSIYRYAGFRVHKSHTFVVLNVF